MSKENTHTVVVVPGLGDDRSSSAVVLNLATRHWKQEGLDVQIQPVLWRDGEDFEPKLLRLLTLVDNLATLGKVSLVGASAGASMAFNVFSQRKVVVHKAVNVCGRLRTGVHKLRSLENMAATSLAFKQSVQNFEKNESTLTMDDRTRLMTIRPFFGDELVPQDTAFLKGAHNTWIYTSEHGLSILLALRFSRSIVNFLAS